MPRRLQQFVLFLMFPQILFTGYMTSSSTRWWYEPLLTGNNPVRVSGIKEIRISHNSMHGNISLVRGHGPNIIRTFLWFLDNSFSNEWNERPKMKNELWVITLIFDVSKDPCLPNVAPNFWKDWTKGSRDTADLNSQEEPKSCMCILSTVVRTGGSISFLWCSLER